MKKVFLFAVLMGGLFLGASPSYAMVYATADVYLYGIDLNSGEMTNIGATVRGSASAVIQGLTVDSIGNLYGTDGFNNLYSIDRTNAELTRIAAPIVADLSDHAIKSMTTYNQKTLAVGGFDVYEFDLNNMTSQRIGVTVENGTARMLNTISFDNNGRLFGADNSYLYLVDPANNNLTRMGFRPTNVQLSNLVFDSENNLFGTSGADLYKWDESEDYWNRIYYTWSLDGKGQHPIKTVNSLARDTSAPVPEPSTLILLGTGLFGAFLRKRRA